MRLKVIQGIIAKINVACSGYAHPTAYADGYESDDGISIYPVVWFNSSLSPDLFVFFHTQEESEFRKILKSINTACNAYGLAIIAYSDLKDETSEVKLSPVVQLNTELHPNLLVFFNIDERTASGVKKGDKVVGLESTQIESLTAPTLILKPIYAYPVL
jgi:hypothetical protein